MGYRYKNGNGYRKQPPREPAPSTRAREFDENGSRAIMDTAGFDAEAREPYADLVSSEAWEIVVRDVFVPQVRRLRRELIHQFNLTPEKRQQDLGFLYYLMECMKELYKRAGVSMPAEIRSEFN